MKRVGVDANVVISFITDRDLQQQARADAFAVLATFDVAFAKKVRKQGVVAYW